MRTRRSAVEALPETRPQLLETWSVNINAQPIEPAPQRACQGIRILFPPAPHARGFQGIPSRLIQVTRVALNPRTLRVAMQDEAEIAISGIKLTEA
jgi:hypothetical protein